MTDTHEPLDQEPLQPLAGPPARRTRPSLRHRLLGLRGVAALALGSVILGSAGGAVLGTVSAGDGVQPGPGSGQQQSQVLQPPGQQGQQAPPSGADQPDDQGDAAGGSDT